jgi:hypothetical protein
MLKVVILVLVIDYQVLYIDRLNIIYHKFMDIILDKILHNLFHLVEMFKLMLLIVEILKVVFLIVYILKLMLLIVEMLKLVVLIVVMLKLVILIVEMV